MAIALNDASVVYQHSAGMLRIRQRRQCQIQGENTMHPTIQTEKTRTNARSRHIRPNSAPAYYLARPASFWITVTIRRAAAPDAGL
jgi:hypothetical protein